MKYIAILFFLIATNVYSQSNRPQKLMETKHEIIDFTLVNDQLLTVYKQADQFYLDGLKEDAVRLGQSKNSLENNPQGHAFLVEGQNIARCNRSLESIVPVTENVVRTREGRYPVELNAREKYFNTYGRELSMHTIARTERASGSRASASSARRSDLISWSSSIPARNAIQEFDSLGRVKWTDRQPYYERKINGIRRGGLTRRRPILKTYQFNTSFFAMGDSTVAIDHEVKFLVLMDGRGEVVDSMEIDLKRPFVRMNTRDEIYQDAVTQDLYIRTIRNGNYVWHSLDIETGDTERVGKVKGLDKDQNWTIVGGKLLYKKKYEFKEVIYQLDLSANR